MLSPVSTTIPSAHDLPRFRNSAIASNRRDDAPSRCTLVWLGSPQPTSGLTRHARSAETLSPVVSQALQCSGFHVDWWPLWPAIDPDWSTLGAVVLALGDDNLDALKAVRQAESIGKGGRSKSAGVPVVWVCATSSVDEQIQALEAGADLCLTWPMSVRELQARLRALMRRADRHTFQPVGCLSAPDRVSSGRDSSAQAPSRTWSAALSLGACRFGEWVLDLATRRLTSPIGRVVVLTLAEFRLLRVFLSRPRQVLTRDALLTEARGAEVDVFDRSVDLVVSRLRTKLDDHPHQPRYIHTVRGVGYLFNADGV